MTARGLKFWNAGDVPLIAPDILGDILTAVADVGLVIADDGTVLSVLLNPAFADGSRFEGVDGTDIADMLTPESRIKFTKRLAAFLTDTGDVRPVEVNHPAKTGRRELPIRYSFHRIGTPGALLLLGRDLRPVADMQQQLVSAQMALERDYEAHRDYEMRFRVLLDSTTDGVLMATMQTGLVSEANIAAAETFGKTRDAILGQPLTSLFDTRQAANMIDRLTTQALSGAPAPVEVALKGGDRTVLLRPTIFRAAGERILLCHIITQGATAASADTLDQSLRGVYTHGPDSMVFAGADAAILSANDSFLNLIGAAHDMSVRGQPLTDLLQRGTVDFKVMTENAAQSGRLRAYATKIAGDYGSPRDVEIAVTRFHAGAVPVFAFVIREVGPADAPRGEPGDDGLSSVKELVGSSTLKDIVAETTNVVERMCIETAIALTMNNRVAAAEMLGLSRQSLYVKLRKFGLIDRDTTI
ncbi:transcriptional regulator PpsR [Loktanella fryxellensis]|uniref:Transcriptional regulator PpsR n=1 Tax=Loktanella fryxellensis TaxID=245187 RepID=A0A1H8CMT3_9RHOB|nr:transcriptional regulator PpsR [Loktanella fryxellensis]SEM96232.1 transcriptional regulator PpsR [Loktanella fryxellensis]